LHFKGDTAKAKQVSDEVFQDFAKMTEKLAKAVQKAQEKG
jgi:ribosome-associated translation inhibitor RaiA